jgi:propane monooxygenase coupling protein
VALVQFLLPENRAVVDRWVADWMPQALEAAAAIAPEAVDPVRGYAEAMLREALDERSETAPARVDVNGSPGPARPGGPSPTAATNDTDSTDTTGDYVGIVMAKSAEGDAVARFFGGRAEVLEQPAFWEIRAPVRLVIPYAEISEELGYAVDAYSIQHEMSTHYGRMVATDDALMLFSDPTEAMEHLLS